ncbi:MAG: serine/threonine-protein kinase [Polyangiaceae bacterium]|jgi:serine/threonine-protein kinase
MNRGLESAAGIREGDILAGKYRVERVLGAGGMGVVVAAHHIQLDEKVALKFLLPDALDNAEAVSRFAREARAAVKIKSEHAARVTDVGTLPNGAPYMVMEYLEGADLAAWLKARGALPIEQAVEFVLQACVAVAEAHALGIVHRDLKPANLFCVRRSDGQLSIKVLDFGISKMVERNGLAAGASTRTAALMGSPLYMSPEQVQSAKDVDAKTDLWALGIILFELLTASVPFPGQAVGEVAVKIAVHEPPSIRGLRPETPPALEAVIRKCLEKDRRRRYANVANLAIALLPFAPKRAKGTVERISGIIQAAGLSQRVLALPPSHQTEAETMVAPETVAPVGRTAVSLARGAKKAVVLYALLGSAAVGLGGFAMVSRRASMPSADAPSTAGTPMPSVMAASRSTMTEAPKNDAPAEALLPLPSETHVAFDSPSAATSGQTSLAAPVGTKIKPPASVPPVPSPPSAPSPPPTAMSRPPAPLCTVVATYDSEGQPHFKKVCK